MCVTEESKGFYYGMFWSIYQSSHIFGSLFGAIVLYEGQNLSVFILIMAIFAILATISFLFIRKPFVPNGRMIDSCHLAGESVYFTESVLGQSLLNQRYEGNSIIGLAKKITSKDLDKAFDGPASSSGQSMPSQKNALK